MNSATHMSFLCCRGDHCLPFSGRSPVASGFIIPHQSSWPTVCEWVNGNALQQNLLVQKRSQSTNNYVGMSPLLLRCLYSIPVHSQSPIDTPKQHSPQFATFPGAIHSFIHLHRIDIWLDTGHPFSISHLTPSDDHNYFWLMTELERQFRNSKFTSFVFPNQITVTRSSAFMVNLHNRRSKYPSPFLGKPLTGLFLWQCQ